MNMPIEHGRKMPLEDAWGSTGVFDYYEGGRRYIRPATSRVVHSVLESHVIPSGKIVEIGSGLGELVYNVLPKDSPLRLRIEQTENSQQLLAKHREIHPDSNVRQANVYALPDASNSVDTFLGYASFDTFAEPHRAVSEMTRALKPGGIIVHFLDLQVARNVFYHNWDPQIDNRIPVPTRKPFTAEHGVMLVPERMLDEAQRKRRRPDATMLGWLKRFGREHAEKEFEELLNVDNYNSATYILEKMEPETVFFNDLFINSYEEAFAASGLQVVEFGKQDAEALIDRDTITDPAVERILFDKNVLSSDMGIQLGKKDETVPGGKVKTISKIHVMVAKKPEVQEAA